jgi:hypothetical protein
MGYLYSERYKIKRVYGSLVFFIYVIAAANMEVDSLADELQRQKEESRQQHEELAILASKLLHAESQIHKVSNVIL